MSLVFISYKHSDRWTPIARRFELRLQVLAPALGFTIFRDEAIDPGELWRGEVQEALAKTTHFVILLCDEYWLSAECQRELHHALERFRASGHKSPKLLFILGERMQPHLLPLDPHDKKGEIVATVGDINFLGPYDGARRLVRLEWNNQEAFSDQIAALGDSLVKLLEKAPAPKKKRRTP